MKWINFKKKVKDDLYEYESASDGLDIWDAISGDVDALNAVHKKKDRRYLFLLLFAIGTMGAAFLIYQTSKDTVEHNPNTTIARKIELNKKESLEETTSALKDISNQGQPESERSINNVKSKKEHAEIFGRTENTSIVLESIKNINNTSEAISSTKKGNSISINDSSSPVKIENRDKLIAISNIQSKKIELQNPWQVATSKKLTQTSTHKNEKFGSTKFNEKTTILDEESNRIYLLISEIASLQAKELEINFSNNLPVKPIAYNDNIQTKLKSMGKFSLGVNAGLFYSHKQLAARDIEGEPLLAVRENTERSLETIHGKIYGDYIINSNLSFSLGLGYSRMNEEFRFVETLEDSRLINGIKYVLIGPGVNPTRFDEMGEVLETTTTVTDYTLFNKYELIDIPMLISYKYNTNKWSYGIQAGIIANLSFKGSGRILASETNIQTISNQNIFKKSLGLSYAMNLVLEHRFNNSFGILFAPSLRFFPNSFTNDSYILTQKQQLIGGDIGFKYYLAK
jgi:hypothetical protein